MNYWQFKFDMKNGDWKEFDTITRGEQFSQSVTAYKKMENCIGDIVFYYRMDKKGIYFIAEIISNPYREEYNTKYAIDMRIIKRLEKPFNDNSNLIYKNLQNKLDPMGQGASKYLFQIEDRGSELYNILMKGTASLELEVLKINEDNLKTVKHIKQNYIDNGYLFNTFHNLNLIRSEVKHLAFIGNLLNPYGNHFKDGLFLKYFIQSLLEYHDLKNNEVLENFINDNPNVKVEKTIKDKDGENIGRVDLWLESDNYIIAIEGKIEAKDNKGQLKKYSDYLKKQDKKYLLIYLTLRKDEEPEKIDAEELDNFHLMNFEQDILDFIDYSIDDDAITANIKHTLHGYKDGLLKYMYKFHLSFQYSYGLIQEITKNKKNFEQYQIIKEYYYQNKNKEKNSVVEDIAENFEYAKAKIERNFIDKLYISIIEQLNESKIDYVNSGNSNLSLEDNDSSIAHDIFNIAKARKTRNKPIITDDYKDLGKVDIVIKYNDEVIKIENNYFGLMIDDGEYNANYYLNKELRDYSQKISSNIFASNNISMLLDNKYANKQIKIILSEISL